ncbi:SecDF P1 head subdomain-containing protein [Bordetella sp. 2513F-2]
MSLTLRKLAPAMALATLVLAGCQTPPSKDQASAPSQPAPPTQQSSVAPVEFYVAHAQPASGLVEVKVPDGALYMQSQPVLTRADLREAAALVDRQGQNFVGLRFTEEGTRKLTDVSTQNVGNMLALVIDRELVAAPRIAEPLNRGVLAFGVPSAQAASEIAAKIRGDVPPPAGSVPSDTVPPATAPSGTVPGQPGMTAPR